MKPPQSERARLSRKMELESESEGEEEEAVFFRGEERLFGFELDLSPFSFPLPHFRGNLPGKRRQVREEPRQRVAQLRQRQRDAGVDAGGLSGAAEPEQRQRQRAADERAPGLARDARRERAPDGRDDVERFRRQLHQRRRDLHVDRGPVLGARRDPAEEEGRDEEGRDEAPDGKGERGGRGELESGVFQAFGSSSSSSPSSFFSFAFSSSSVAAAGAR